MQLSNVVLSSVCWGWGFAKSCKENYANLAIILPHIRGVGYNLVSNKKLKRLSGGGTESDLLGLLLISGFSKRGWI